MFRGSELDNCRVCVVVEGVCVVVEGVCVQKCMFLIAGLPVLMKMSRYNFFWFCKIFKTLREILR
jgi:hypothetical protein